jgi:hypothetical protein
MPYFLPPFHDLGATLLLKKIWRSPGMWLACFGFRISLLPLFPSLVRTFVSISWRFEYLFEPFVPLILGSCVKRRSSYCKSRAPLIIKVPTSFKGMEIFDKGAGKAPEDSTEDLTEILVQVYGLSINLGGLVHFLFDSLALEGLVNGERLLSDPV